MISITEMFLDQKLLSEGKSRDVYEKLKSLISPYAPKDPKLKEFLRSLPDDIDIVNMCYDKYAKLGKFGKRGDETLEKKEDECVENNRRRINKKIISYLKQNKSRICSSEGENKERCIKYINNKIQILEKFI